MPPNLMSQLGKKSIGQQLTDRLNPTLQKAATQIAPTIPQGGPAYTGWDLWQREDHWYDGQLAEAWLARADQLRSGEGSIAGIARSRESYGQQALATAELWTALANYLRAMNLRPEAVPFVRDELQRSLSTSVGTRIVPLSSGATGSPLDHIRSALSQAGVGIPQRVSVLLPIVLNADATVYVRDDLRNPGANDGWAPFVRRRCEPPTRYSYDTFTSWDCVFWKFGGFFDPNAENFAWPSLHDMFAVAANIVNSIQQSNPTEVMDLASVYGRDTGKAWQLYTGAEPPSETLPTPDGFQRHRASNAEIAGTVLLDPSSWNVKPPPSTLLDQQEGKGGGSGGGGGEDKTPVKKTPVTKDPVEDPARKNPVAIEDRPALPRGTYQGRVVFRLAQPDGTYATRAFEQAWLGAEPGSNSTVLVTNADPATTDYDRRTTIRLNVTEFCNYQSGHPFCVASGFHRDPSADATIVPLATIVQQPREIVVSGNEEPPATVPTFWEQYRKPVLVGTGVVVTAGVAYGLWYWWQMRQASKP